MPPQTNRSPGRLLAPVALVTVFVALLLVVLGSTGTQDSKTSETGSRTQSASTGPRAPRAPARSARGVYTVKRGDNLGEIAERNGTTVDTLQELNPDLDARTLVPGQKIKLRQ